MADRHGRWLLVLSDGRTDPPWVTAGADLVLWLEVVEHHGLMDPRWATVGVYRLGPEADVPEATEGCWLVEADAMVLPPATSPAPQESPENRFLVNLCQVPDPDLVNEWMNLAREVTIDVPFRRELWAEVRAVAPDHADLGWGEIHVSRVEDRWAVDRIFSNETWLEGQALLDKVIGMSYRMVCRPLVDNGPPGRPFDGS